MEPTDPMAALMFRKAQLQAQEQAAMQPPQQPAIPPPGAPVMSQAQFSGYGQRPQLNPQQIQQLAMLLQKRQ